ncbi:MAG: hypothetical protein R3F46_13440 [bacterium]
MSRTADSTESTRKASPPARGSTRGSGRRSRRRSAGMEVLRVIGSIIGILLGLVVTLFCLGVWYASRKGAEILQEIAERDVSGPRSQVDKYGEFFSGLDSEQFIVRRDEPRNLQNVITYLWTVEHRQSGEVTQFRWEWNMSGLDVLPRSNGALLLDLRLHNLTDSEAREYGFFDPDDTFAVAIVNQDISIIGMDDISDSWGGTEYSDGVAPPLISPDDARGRADKYLEDQQKKLDEEQAAAGKDNETERSPGESSEVGISGNHPASPPVSEDL